MTGFLAGFWLGLSLIVAIGAQNAFILKQGLRRQHVFVLSLVCAVSDALLIVAGVFGFAVLSAKLALVEPVARYGGALFLFYYGLRSFRAAFTTSETLEAASGSDVSLRTALLTCLAFTWLNPHVYLDTIVLLGSVSTQYPDARVEFAAGAATGSFAFFFSLGYGARLLAPIFKNPKAWNVLVLIIGCVMWTIAVSLLI